ncbi:NPCBM-associated, NEW3 domain of alpha-galactosidase [uncultured archaeon]|nr:NPCBM-associated, NEW3 domain of alpha-galactosidase [uncultured archaeon]
METKTWKMAFAAFALLLFAGFASASVNPKMQLLNYSVSEVPAQPGHVLALTLHMKSVESDNCAERVAVQIAVSYPLSVRGPDTQYVDLLCYQDPDSKGTFTFYLPVDNLATSGTYPVSVSTTYEKRFTKLSESNTLNIQVGGAPSFAASVVSSNPVDIYPGDSAQVTVSFQNTGASMVTAARASANAPRGIVVKWAGQSQDIGQIASHGSATATFSIEAPKDIPSGTYPLNVQLDYTGEDAVKGSASFNIGVPVKPKADFSAAMASDSLLPGQKREVNVALTNTGSQEARKVEVRIKPLFPFSTDGTVRYIEALKPGETQNLTYVITVDKDATSGGQLIGVLIDFEDPQGKKMSDTADFSMPVRLPTLVEEITGYWYVLAILVVAGAFFLMKRKGAAAKKA